MNSRTVVYLIVLICCIATKASAYKLSDSVILRRVIFEGNRRTRESVMLREMSVTAGDKVPAGHLFGVAELNRKRLMNLPLFSEVVIVTDTVNADTIDWHVQVREQFFILPELNVRLADRNFNVWWEEQNHSLRRINLGMVLKHRNFRGNLEQVALTLQSGYTQKIGLSYLRPYIDKKQKNGLGASFFLSKNEEIYYNTSGNKLLFVRKPGNYIFHQFEAAGQYVHRPGYADKHIVELRYRSFRVDDTILKLNPGYFDTGSNKLQMMELNYRYEHNEVDNWNYPLTGFKVVNYWITRAGIKGMKMQSLVQTELGYFRRLPAKFYLAAVFRGRLTLPNNVPYYLRNAMGSNSEYIRGYEYYVVDGSQYGILRGNIKYELLNIKIRRIPIRFISVIPLRLYPKIYADIGYATNKFPGNSFLNDRLLKGYGVGIDIVSGYEVKLRIEYSFNQLGQKGLFLHLNSE